jgi:hypothetical protein
MPKLAERLTDIKVKIAKPKDKPYKFAVGRGLHLLVKTDGSKHWQFRFRFDGKENAMAIGRYPEVSIANAEKKATGALELLAEGIILVKIKRWLRLLKRVCLQIDLKW